MSLASRIFTISLLSLGSLVSAGEPGYEKTFANGTKQPTEIIFRTAGGRVKERISLKGKEYTKDGRRIAEAYELLEPKSQSSVVISHYVGDPEEENPYAIMGSPSTTLNWHAASGDVLCRLQFGGLTGARLISDDGSALVVIQRGFEEVEFEKFRGKPRNAEEAALNLTENRLRAYAKDCKILLDERGTVKAFGEIKISSSGQWIAFTTGDVERKPGGGLLRKIRAVNLTNNKSSTVMFPELIDGIENDGTVFYWKYEGRSAESRTEMGPDGMPFKVFLRKFRKFILSPGDASVHETNEIMTK